MAVRMPGLRRAAGPALPCPMAIFSRLTGAFLLCVVALVYYANHKLDRPTSGHPWSGLTLSLLALTFVFYPAKRMAILPPQLRWFRAVGMVLALIGALLWFGSAITIPPMMP